MAPFIPRPSNSPNLRDVRPAVQHVGMPAVTIPGAVACLQGRAFVRGQQRLATSPNLYATFSATYTAQVGLNGQPFNSAAYTGGPEAYLPLDANPAFQHFSVDPPYVGTAPYSPAIRSNGGGMDASHNLSGYFGLNQVALPEQSQNFQAGVPGTTVADQDDRQLPLQLHQIVPQSTLTPQPTSFHLPGYEYPGVSSQLLGNYTSAGIHNEYAATGLPLSHQAGYGFETSRPLEPAPDTRNTEPYEPPRPAFEPQSVKRPASKPLSDEDARKQKEEARARKEKLKEFGGACVWCCQNKRACDPRKFCEGCIKRNVPCLRSHQQIWLYSNTASNSSQPSNASGVHFPTLPRAKRQTFEHVNVLLCKLRSEVTDQELFGQGVLQVRRRFPKDSGTMSWDSKLLKEPLQDYSVTQERVDDLVNLASLFVSPPDISADPASLDGALFSPVFQMIRLIGFLTSLSRAEVFGRAVDRATTRLALLQFIAHLAMAISQFSAKFATELIRRLKLKKNNSVMRTELYIATGLYFRLLHALGTLSEQGTLISKTISGITSNLESIRELLSHLLRTTYLAQSPVYVTPRNDDSINQLREQRSIEDFKEYIPQVTSLCTCQVAFSLDNEYTPHNFHAFGASTHMTVAQLLTEPMQLPQTLPAPMLVKAEPGAPAVRPREVADPLDWFDFEQFTKDVQEGRVIVSEGEEDGDEIEESQVQV